MIEIFLTGTEVEIVLRAFKLAKETGQFPDPAIKGDDTRAIVLEDQFKKKLEEHEATTWGGRMKAQKNKP